ncbi:Hypothetical_protein [Hexamita inflata]|uniref:Hypothetical_protein n=1 Tax=Hexamita inflata TaxID=28002 RepID=A0AA86TXZ1_9EUKA|nr:Hypothetical protein HINF_LOCUS20206 [Hexamita inflata]
MVCAVQINSIVQSSSYLCPQSSPTVISGACCPTGSSVLNGICSCPQFITNYRWVCVLSQRFAFSWNNVLMSIWTSCTGSVNQFSNGTKVCCPIGSVWANNKCTCTAYMSANNMYAKDDIMNTFSFFRHTSKAPYNLMCCASVGDQSSWNKIYYLCENNVQLQSNNSPGWDIRLQARCRLVTKK